MREDRIEGFDSKLIDAIGKSNDGDKLYRLSENQAFSIALHQILNNLYEADPNGLNEPQMNLFLSMHLENSGQSCGMLACLQEWFPQHLNKFVPALKEIKALKSALAVEKAINLLPEDGSWFFESANDSTKFLMREYDCYFSDYPDGSMPDLYRAYAEEHKEAILNF